MERDRVRLPLLISLLATTSLLAQAEGVGRVGQGGGWGDYSASRAGDGGNYSSYSNYNKQLNTARDMAQNPAKYTQQPAAAAGGAPAEAPGPKSFTVYSKPKPQPTWKQLVQHHRKLLAGRPKDVLVEALASDEPARVFAALSFENEGKARFSEPQLARILNSTRVRDVARGAALLLSRRRTASAEDALLAHVEKQGPADETALEFLLQMNSKKGKPILMERAARADASDTASLMAIRALAFQPGDDVIILLHRLSGDWSEDVQKAAAEAIALRKKAGLKSRTPYRAPPVGKTPEEIAFIPGSEADPTLGQEPASAAEDSEKPTPEEEKAEAAAMLEKAAVRRIRAAEVARQNAAKLSGR